MNVASVAYWLFLRTNVATTTDILSEHVYTATKAAYPAFDGNYLEIGIFNGIGTADIARTFPDRKIFAVDPFIEDGYTTGASDLERGQSLVSHKETAFSHLMPLGNVIIAPMTSKEFDNHLTAQDILEYNISWVVIDGSHHYEDVRLDAELAKRLIDSKRGAVVFDDLQHSGVMQAYEEFIERYSYRITQHFRLDDNQWCGIVELGGKV
jgi:hypothetical protein